MLQEYPDVPPHTLVRGDNMDRHKDIQAAIKELELEIMLYINERLLASGDIAQDAHDRARELIIKS